MAFAPVLTTQVVLFRPTPAHGKIQRVYKTVNMADGGGEVTALLRAWSGGDRSVEDRLFQLVLPDLRKIAGALMNRERSDHSLQPTALLNETYFRLVMLRESPKSLASDLSHDPLLADLQKDPQFLELLKR